jgi:polyisoprenoid-binding protein YceI
MLVRTLAALTVTSCLLVGVTQDPPPPTAPETATASDVFTVDSTHSTLIYHLRHFGVSDFHGRINLPGGSFRIDDEDPSGSSLHILAEIKNMDTGNDGRDRFLMSPDFFNVREFPTAEFRSTSITRVGEGRYEATGDFTMHGVTKTITVQVAKFTATQTTRFGYRGGFECIFTVNRSEFGMGLFVEEGTLGDEVTIKAAIEGVQQPT